MKPHTVTFQYRKNWLEPQECGPFRASCTPMLPDCEKSLQGHLDPSKAEIDSWKPSQNIQTEVKPCSKYRRWKWTRAMAGGSAKATMSSLWQRGAILETKSGDTRNGMPKRMRNELLSVFTCGLESILLHLIQIMKVRQQHLSQNRALHALMSWMLLISPPADIASDKTKGNMIHHANPNWCPGLHDVIFGDAMLESKVASSQHLVWMN